ncbi:MAG: thioredoxin family protein [Thaumarchaeota archaeon]|nr:thioredoxin family protein [Nitrososphaerota archaeon]MCY3976346.1 thioredoxin family protein [Nitrososphaerota archaeon]
MVLLESGSMLAKNAIAPDFSLIGIDNKIHSLKDYQDYELLLIIFICNHCPYVQAKINAINGIYNKFNDRLAMVAINSNDAINYIEDNFENMKKMAKNRNIKFDYLFDETQEIAKKFGAKCTPDPFLFNKHRKLVFHGRIDNAMKLEDEVTEKTMINNIEKLLQNLEINDYFIPSIGCSIKWKKQ